MTATDDRHNFYLGEILVAPQHNQISLGDRALKLQPKVMAVLAYLAKHQERVISAEELMDELWKGRVVTQSSVQKSMNSLRSALADLQADREFVAHFSKRGYQLVVPARFLVAAETETGASPPPAAIKPNVLVGVLLVVGLSVAALFWTFSKPREIPVPPHLHLTEFQSSLGFTSEVGHERSAEPHPDGEKVAYVRDTSADGTAQSQILVRDRDGRDWLLASAEGTWMNLAWSPSGRNLVAVEMGRVDGSPRGSTFYEKPHYLYSFHIFTLDFTGRRLLEKNLLSQWQGTIESVTWWDENTLEFVASQGPDSSNERYRYVIAEQQLSMLNALASGFTPQQSLVREKISAVLSRRGNRAQVEFLDTGQKTIAAWPVTTSDIEISWIPDGSGVLILEKDSADFYTLYLNGAKSPIHFPQNSAFSISYPRYRKNGQSILLGAVAVRTQLSRLTPEGGHYTLSGGDYHNDLPRFSADGTELVFTSLRNNQYQVWHLRDTVEERLFSVDKSITRIIWPHGENFLLYKSGRDIGMYRFDDRTSRLLLDRAAATEPLAYDPNKRTLLVIKQTGDARNLWQINLSTRAEKQLTFGAVASALAHKGQTYFQYRNQRGLWVLAGDGQNPQQVSTHVPHNSQLLRAVAGGIYFVSGGPCRESAIQYLDLDSGLISTTLDRAENKVVSHDFHPHGGVLQTYCNLPESNIIELQPL